MTSNFIDTINGLLKFRELYFETKTDYCFDCRIKKALKLDSGLLKELVNLGVLSANKNRYTKVLKVKGKNYRWIVINKDKFKSLERLMLLR